LKLERDENAAINIGKFAFARISSYIQDSNTDQVRNSESGLL
jgi:hypothetical protein